VNVTPLLAGRQSEDPAVEESGRPRPDPEEVRRRLTALQIEKIKPPSRTGRLLLAFAAATVLVVVALAYSPIAAAIRGTVGKWTGKTVSITAVRPVTQTPGMVDMDTPLLTASGYIVARREAVVSAKIQGLLTELNVDVGDMIAQGQVIARLQSSEFDARILNSKAGIQVAQATLDENRRQLRLADELQRSQVLSRDQKDAATSRVNASEASLALAQADLRTQEVLKQDTVIRAPFAGMVVKKMAEVGESVSPIPPGVNISTSSGAIVAVADIRHLEVEVDVGEASIGKLKPGMFAEVIVPAFPDHKYRGSLRQLVPTADRTKGTVQAKVSILDANKDLKPEMTAQVTFLQGPLPASAGESLRPVITVPQQALVTRAGITLLFEVLRGTVHERVVTTGARRDGQVVISRGLDGQESLVLLPPPGMREGDAVRVVVTRGAE
jgi:RND family efflux transporter MFP subunit